MTFDVSGEAYDNFMGRYARELAPAFADFAGVEAGQTAVDVGCGSGILTEELARRLGPEAVAAADPSPLAEAATARVPGADVRTAAAENLPWPDGSFDAALAQLVLHFLEDPAAGLREMRRVVRPGGVVAACSWNFPKMGLLHTFWESAREVTPGVDSEALEVDTLEEFAQVGREAGLEEVEAVPQVVSSRYESFDELWETFQRSVGPAGEYLASVPSDTADAIRDAYRRRLGDPPAGFTLAAEAWAVRGRA
ncbi:MAG: class I SAM-dependent methyltransferase [Gaiellaceae bacterium]